ncbi:uncharacterized protein EI97DRAFT_468732 [Westerdykella ornata]|uniref:Uncharacterized protein n=1 Tax=Westerdykella ornata TaxID=318751 RepID=A0A6A6JEF8_WESOR|nr:uncharacterized protein EI97DRAFT_468732 [Westerdykella ornata]KAF2274553.1 hypothetical protein EI97DRAFT_468732 [Westerdykella ornata]
MFDHEAIWDMIVDYLDLLQYVLPSPVISMLTSIISLVWGIYKTAETALRPLVNRVATEPDFKSILILVLVLFAAYKILHTAYRVVIAWIRLGISLVMWAGIATVSLWIYARGIDGFVDDVQEQMENWLQWASGWQSHVSALQRQKAAQLKKQQRAHRRYY